MKAILGAGVLAAAAGLSGCATVTNPNPADPLEGWNRRVQGFNDTVDEAVLKPVAETYRDVVPQLMRTGVTNFFNNLSDGWSAVNHALQGKVEPAANMTLRVAVNTVFGLAGVLDPATEFGLERQPEDLGQTLGRWGVGAGPYLVWPLLGPSTLRDSAGMPLDMAATSISLVGVDDGNLFAATSLQLVNTRANLLSASRMLDDLALDRYTFLRDAYLARRRNQVYDGDPPEEPLPEDEDEINPEPPPR